ncbi:MAG: DUF1801 domain-containing protein [Flavobacteriales bacterium]|nr:DUF1801 domain-containing protein [Flavobacteriales bacterium]MBP9080920.1 DUF1801 domain-containing protein [Flavobacteriales bacterium]
MPEPTKQGKPTRPATKPGTVRLLTGGNPQIAKGYGDAPVQTYLQAIPDWKREVAVELDALITRAVPKLFKAVKWNTPMYGMEGNGYFMGFNMTTKYVKVAFFHGALLEPLPPDASTQKKVRYLHIREHDVIDKKQVTAWVKQAAKLPGVKM